MSQSKADAFEYADQVLEKWYPTIEEGNNKGIVVLVAGVVLLVINKLLIKKFAKETEAKEDA